jgi:PQQ-dependent dehydrogenase (methanol/ethanol family)
MNKKRTVICIAACILIGLAVDPSLNAVRSTRAGDVTQARVMSEESSGNNWLVGGRTFGAQHFSPLKQISDKSIGNLGLAWSTDIDTRMGLPAEPLVVDGTAYISAPFSIVYALNAGTGKILWKFDPKVRLDLSLGSSYAARINRGVAVWNGKVFVGTGDCRLVAIDAASGRQVWESKVCDPLEGLGSAIDMAPRVGKGKVFVGSYGSDLGVRGFVAGFDAETGKELWRFWTVPGDPAKPYESKALEMAAKTWPDKDDLKEGGAVVWDGMTYDEVSGLLFFGTDGTGILDGKRYPGVGDRLFSECIIAVNPDTGEYVWHYATTPNDSWDYNVNVPITAADLTIAGQKRRVVMVAPKNGFFYVLEAGTGKLLSAKPIAKVTWATSVDLETGRPVEIAAALERKPGERVPALPTGLGAHNWHAQSYSPLTGLVYIPAVDAPPGYDIGSEEGSHLIGELLAWDPVSQSARWSVQRPNAVNGGTLSTAGNLVFQGTATGEFAAYAADDGRSLWSVQTGSSIEAAPVTYTVDKEQYVLIPVGWGAGTRMWESGQSASREGMHGPSRLMAFKLGATTPMPVTSANEIAVPKPPDQTFSPEQVKLGQSLWWPKHCWFCHGDSRERTLGGAPPDLRYSPPEVHRDWYAIVLGGSRADKGMLGFTSIKSAVPTQMTPQEADALHAYIIDRSWKAYNEQQNEQSRQK